MLTEHDKQRGINRYETESRIMQNAKRARAILHELCDSILLASYRSRRYGRDWLREREEDPAHR